MPGCHPLRRGARSSANVGNTRFTTWGGPETDVHKGMCEVQRVRACAVRLQGTRGTGRERIAGRPRERTGLQPQVRRQHGGERRAVGQGGTERGGVAADDRQRLVDAKATSRLLARLDERADLRQAVVKRGRQRLHSDHGVATASVERARRHAGREQARAAAAGASSVPPGSRRLQ